MGGAFRNCKLGLKDSSFRLSDVFLRPQSRPLGGHSSGVICVLMRRRGFHM